jgi:hypothetical protein
MTMNQAVALRIKWTQQAVRSPCMHLNLEVEWNEAAIPMGNYVCILCGEPVAQRYLAAQQLPQVSSS